MEVGRVELPSVPFPAVDCVQVCAREKRFAVFRNEVPDNVAPVIRHRGSRSSAV